MAGARLAQEVDAVLDGCERVSQFVRQHGKKFALAAIGLEQGMLGGLARRYVARRAGDLLDLSFGAQNRRKDVLVEAGDSAGADERRFVHHDFTCVEHPLDLPLQLASQVLRIAELEEVLADQAVVRHLQEIQQGLVREQESAFTIEGVDEVRHGSERRVVDTRLLQGNLCRSAQPLFGILSLGDVDSMGEDARDGTVRPAKDLVHEVEVAQLPGRTRNALQLDRHGAANPRSSCLVDVFEQLEKSLSLDFRERLADRQADQRAVADHLVVDRVGNFDDQLRPAQDHHERWRQVDDLGQVGRCEGDAGTVVCHGGA